MILQALKEYYDRKAADPESGIAPEGWEPKELPFLIVLDPSGFPVGIEDTREGDGKKKRAKTFLVPKAEKRTVGIAANLLWDNVEYALGEVVKGRPERVADQHSAFRERLSVLPAADDAGVKAVATFLLHEDKPALLQQFGEAWKEVKETGAFISFRLVGDTEPVFRRPAVIQAITSSSPASGEESICLASGEIKEVERLHPAIKGVRDANSTGANIVGFNLDAFRSYGKEQGFNSPIGKATAFAYTTSLNALLSRDSRQKMQVGDATTVFWASKETPFEWQVTDFFDEPPKDDPDRLSETVRSLYRSTQTGAYAADADDTRFYVLGLSPNSARISVRFWHVGTVAEMADRIRQHFDDLRLVHGPRDREAISLWRLLVATAPLGKSENIPPSVAGDAMRAVLEGTPYPRTLLQAAVRRNRAEQEVTYARASLIKACLNRENRFYNRTTPEEMTMSLDLANMNPGYRLGRLFAVLERIQERANPGTNATIRDRFYGAASSTPRTVFGNLMRLKNHHLAKLEHQGSRINLERLLGEVMGGLQDFPPHLAIADQGRFAIGYYHQRQDFFTRKPDEPTTPSVDSTTSTLP